jgi:hypothetical protein
VTYVDNAIPLILAAALAATLAVSAGFLLRNLLRRRDQQRERRAREDWRLAEELAEGLRGPHAEQRIDDLRFLARAEAGHILTRVRLREVVRESLSRVGPEVPAEWLVHEGGDPYVQADQDALGHALDVIFRSLIERAEHRVVRVQVTADGPQASLTVSAETPFDRQRLALASRIVETQGGEVHLQDVSVNFRLPLSI